MPRLVNRLNAKSAGKIAADKKPGVYNDGDGLHLSVTKRGSVSWLLIYRFHYRRRKMGLGPFRRVSLEEARKKAAEARKLLDDGKDPLAHRETRRAKRAASLTFHEAAKAFLAAAESKLTNPRSVDQWRATMLGLTRTDEKTEHNYCAPIANMPVGDVDTPAVLRVLKPIWTEKNITAQRIRERIEKIIAYAVVHGLAGEVDSSRPNPARWGGHLEFALPARSGAHEVKHFPALAYADVPAFLAQLRTRGGVAAKAMEFAVLTATRTADVLGAQWEDVDLDARTWTIPKTKNGAEHRVPLSDVALDLLEQVRAWGEGSTFVFPGAKRGSPLSQGSMLATRNRMIEDGLVAAGAMTTHGFRSAFKSWASDQTSAEHAVVEACLAHTINSAVERAYLRSDFYAKRARLMQSWADFVEGKAASNVIPLSAAR